MNTDRSGLIEKALTERVIGSFFEVYGKLGFGFLESVYENALVVELRRAGVTGLPLGLLFNFGPRAQFRRRINTRR